jgi:hypothetical protein
MTTGIETADLRRALEALWTDIGVLARNPLVEQLGLVKGWSERDRQDAYKRALALINAILDAARQLQGSGREEAFMLLDQAYGLERGYMEKRITSTESEELFLQAGLTAAEYERRLNAAVADLQSVL